MDIDVSLAFPNVEHCMDTFKNWWQNRDILSSLWQRTYRTQMVLWCMGFTSGLHQRTIKLALSTCATHSWTAWLKTWNQGSHRAPRISYRNLHISGNTTQFFPWEGMSAVGGNQAIIDLCSHYNMDSDKALSVNGRSSRSWYVPSNTTETNSESCGLLSRSFTRLKFPLCCILPVLPWPCIFTRMV